MCALLAGNSKSGGQIRTTGIGVGVGVRAKAQQLGLIETHFDVAAQRERRIQLSASFFATTGGSQQLCESTVEQRYEDG